MSKVDEADDTALGGRSVDIAAGLSLAVLSLVALFWLIPNHTQPADSQFDVAPGFFPNLAASVVLLLSVVLVARRWGQTPTGGGGVRILAELGVWSALAVAIMLALSNLSFLIMAPAVIAGAMLFSGNRTWWLILVMAVVFPLAVEGATWVIFTVDLP